jgi:hypothetical protein
MHDNYAGSNDNDNAGYAGEQDEDDDPDQGTMLMLICVLVVLVILYVSVKVYFSQSFEGRVEDLSSEHTYKSSHTEPNYEFVEVKAHENLSDQIEPDGFDLPGHPGFAGSIVRKVRAINARLKHAKRVNGTPAEL